MSNKQKYKSLETTEFITLMPSYLQLTKHLNRSNVSIATAIRLSQGYTHCIVTNTFAKCSGLNHFITGRS